MISNKFINIFTFDIKIKLIKFIRYFKMALRGRGLQFGDDGD